MGIIRSSTVRFAFARKHSNHWAFQKKDIPTKVSYFVQGSTNLIQITYKYLINACTLT